MSTPVDMHPLFWLLVVTPTLWVSLVWLVGTLLVPASHVDPHDVSEFADEDERFDRDDDVCGACGDPCDLTGHCGCGLAPKRRLERTRETWA